MTSTNATSTMDAVRELNESDPEQCHNGLGKGWADCLCPGCKLWRKRRGYSR